jgi:predicted acetyltransferase
MSIHYRLLHPDEEGQAVALWMSVLETSQDEAVQTFRDFRDAPQRFNQAHVAVAADGQLLATVCYWLREVRNIDGTSVPIAHLFHVATEASARGQGLATRLLDTTIAAVRTAGCQWAILSARQDAVPLYQRAGWQPTPRRYWRGTYVAEARHGHRMYPTQHADPRREVRGWEQMAAAYAHANTQQAGSLVRSPAYWSGYSAWMFGLYLDSYQATLLTVRDETPNASVRGYALTNFYDTGFEVSELVADPGDPNVLYSLLQGIKEEAQQRGLPAQGQLTVAHNTITQPILEECFGTTLHYVDDSALHGYVPFMVRPIGDVTASPFAVPQGLFWPLDAY